jgi:hypothetical protein
MAAGALETSAFWILVPPDACDSISGDIVRDAYRFGKASAGLGWLLVVVGIPYIALGMRAALGGIAGSLARILVGLVAVVVGSSIVRWARRATSR